jgi:ABC-type Fe3+ transport system permease subunit
MRSVKLVTQFVFGGTVAGFASGVVYFLLNLLVKLLNFLRGRDDRTLWAKIQDHVTGRPPPAEPASPWLAILLTWTAVGLLLGLCIGLWLVLRGVRSSDDEKLYPAMVRGMFCFFIGGVLGHLPGILFDSEMVLLIGLAVGGIIGGLAAFTESFPKRP